MNETYGATLPFYSEEFDRSAVQTDAQNFEVVTSVLNDPRLGKEITEGNITLAMIRPNVGPQANLEGLDDLTCALQIEDMIQGLGVAAKFSFKFTVDAVKEFYGGGPQASMESEAARDAVAYPNRWPEFIEDMTHDPTTAILLHSPAGDAIDLWRGHLGHWNIDKFRDPTTIRGILGVNKFNNLVHGSDSPTSVQRELKIIKKCL